MLKLSYNYNFRNGKYDQLASSAHGLREFAEPSILFDSKSFSVYINAKYTGKMKKTENENSEWYDYVYQGRPYKIQREENSFFLYGLIKANGSLCVNHADKIPIRARPGKTNGIAKPGCNKCQFSPPEDFTIRHLPNEPRLGI